VAPARGRRPVEPEVLLSASGLTRLGECEQRWLWHPSDDAPEQAKGRALDLGTDLHALVEARMRKLDWRATLLDLAAEVPGWEPGYNLPEPLPTAEWLIERHEAVYPKLPQVVATENQFELWLPYGGVATKVRGRMDGIVLLTHEDLVAIFEDMKAWAWPSQLAAAEAAVVAGPGLYVLEVKSMGKWDRLDWLAIDPQLGTYIWAAREMGFVDIKGVLYDAILTTQWKTEEGEVYKTGPRAGQPKNYHPPTDNFRRLVLPVSEPLVDATIDLYRRAADRAKEIQDNPERAIKSQGRNCGYCPAFKSCHPYAAS
jgi:hypothetical protein